MLIASTPEGARDFVVPSRLSPGEFYALPQSPQLFKQLLMVGGLDRYYQIARCLRDEDLRADRQFEFMQLDAEMSFAGADDVMAVIGGAVAAAAEAVTGEPVPAIERMTWHEAMERFGTDKPDLRFGLELVDVSEVFAATEFKAFQAEVVKAIRVPGEGGMSRSKLDALIDRAKQLGAAGLVWMRVGEGRALDAPILKFLAEQEQLGLVDATGAEPGDLLLLAAGDRRLVNRVLGTIRLDLGRPPVHEGPLRFLWVVDFPLFEAIDDDGRPIPAHHPFTMPHPDDLELLAAAAGSPGTPGSSAALLDVRSLAYDLVLNGWELGSGSVRIHRPRRAGARSSRCSASTTRPPEPASASCSTRSASAHRPTPASPSASTGSPRSSPARRTSARSSPSRRPSPAPTHSPARRHRSTPPNSRSSA